MLLPLNNSRTMMNSPSLFPKEDQVITEIALPQIMALWILRVIINRIQAIPCAKEENRRLWIFIVIALVLFIKVIYQKIKGNSLKIIFGLLLIYLFLAAKMHLLRLKMTNRRLLMSFLRVINKVKVIWLVEIYPNNRNLHKI